MKTTVTEEGLVKFEQVYNPIVLETDKGETISVCMRDSGFEFCYDGQMWFAKGGYVEPFHKSIRDNYLVSELQYHREDSVCNGT